MEAQGVITIFAKKSAFPDYPPGVMLCEKKDGKGFEEVVPVTQNEGYRYTIPFTEHNILLASKFWCRRGCKVTVELKPLVNPFKQEDYDKWFIEDNKENVALQKKMVKAEADLKKIRDSLPSLEEAILKEDSLYQVEVYNARESKKAIPPKHPDLVKAQEAMESARGKIESLKSQIEVMRLEIVE